jgi:asparagine synthase (glutamine-hydrolysing)
MCGIAGIYCPNGLNQEEAKVVVKAMSNSLKHRGPDDSGQWVDGGSGVALGHQRLSVVDLSPAGHQPMVSVSGRYVLILNGEIYNHSILRKEIELAVPMPWCGRSDTETFLACVEQWGIKSALKKSVGMFAIALWDRELRILTLARDRMGEKPLYYGWQGDTFLFGSELKAIKTHPAFQNQINRNVMPLYLRHGYIPSPYSIYKDIHKLLPGTFLQISHQQKDNTLPNPIPYWALRQIIEEGYGNPFTGSDEEAIRELESKLKHAISLQRIADVPLGAFLSGGIDSSLIVALMQAQSMQPVKTFTIGFSEKSFNEAEHAKEVAKHLGTDHTELYVTPSDAMEVIPRLSTLYDEPFGDSSQIPTFLVAQMTRRDVTVALSGDGGDELFGGYKRYERVQNIWDLHQKIPPRIRRFVASSLSKLSPALIDRMLSPFIRQSAGKSAANKVQSLTTLLSSESRENFYRTNVSHWSDPVSLVPGSIEPLTVFTDPSQWLQNGQLYDRMMYFDGMSYLPDDILAKVDRAAMGVSLEARIPMLDHRLIEFAWQLPFHTKVRNNQRKWILRQVLYKYVPEALIDRPKKGFGIPVGQWLRGPLRDWAESLLSKECLVKTNIFDVKLIRRCWLDHLSGKCNYQDAIWAILMFQKWHRENLNQMESSVNW